MIFISVFAFTGVLASAQPYQYTPSHTYESFYTKFRREQFKTALADYELAGPVKEMRLVYQPAQKGMLPSDTQRFNFSERGLLTRYTCNDPSDDRTKWSNDAGAVVHELHYNENNQLDSIHMTEFSKANTEAVWESFDAAGFLASAGHGRNSPAIHYVYRRSDSLLSVTTQPFYEYNIFGNVIADTVHFTLDRNGRVTKETMFYFWGEETITFSWNSDTSFTYSINGRSYMEESGTWTCNRAGRLLRTASQGYYINQQGTRSYAVNDSLVYNTQGWIAAEYNTVQRQYDGYSSLDLLEAGEQPHAQKRRYDYTVDARGNWTVRRQYGANDRLTGTEFRTIVYY